jgi:hypothetical protein
VTKVDAVTVEEVLCGACVEPPPDMVAWWPLDETSGTNADEVVNNNDGTHIGGPAPLAGEYVDNSLCFDGSTQYVEAPDAPELNFGVGDFSVDAWIRTSQTSGVQKIVDKRLEVPNSVVGYSFFVSSGALAFQLADGNGTNAVCGSADSTCTNYSSGVVVADGQWHHVAVTVDRDDTSGGTWYVDGSPVATPFDPTLRTFSLTNTNPLRIASRSSSVSGLFNGCIDEVELFDRELDASEIAAIFAAGTEGKCKPTPCPCDCAPPPDGQVSVLDFLALLAQWGGPGPCDCEDPPDGAVDVGDFLAMLAAWGPCP